MTNANDATFAMPEALTTTPEKGLSKREYFAALNLQALLTDTNYESIEAAAEDAVHAADTLIAALNAKPAP